VEVEGWVSGDFILPMMRWVAGWSTLAHWISPVFL
jgi:hypothetical protein